MNYENKIIEFLTEIENFGKTMIIPKSANQDLKHYFENRSARLKRFNLTEYLIFDKEKIGIHNLNIPFLGKYAKFNSKKYYTPIDVTKTYFHNKSKIFRKNGYISYYFEVSDIDNNSNQIKSIENCPNCGSPSSIKTLENDGCPYCHTKFIVSDLFPNISNYYTYDGGLKSVKRNKSMVNTINILILIAGIITALLFAMLPDNNTFSRIIFAFLGFIFGAIACGFVILPIWLVVFFTRMVSKSVSNLDVAPKLYKSKEEIDEIMKRYDPNFSYSYFESKVLNLVRNILIDDERDLSPQNKISQLDPIFNNLIDITYRQVIDLVKVSESDGFLNVQICVYLENDYFISNKIKTIKESFLVDMKHNQNHNVDLEFKLSAVRCNGCGASFDASHHSNCVYCGCEYHAEDDDWVVTSIQKSS